MNCDSCQALFLLFHCRIYPSIFQGAATRAISDRMATTRVTAGDAPITFGVDVAISSTDSAPGSAVGTRSKGCAGLVSETCLEITPKQIMLVVRIP